MCAKVALKPHGKLSFGQFCLLDILTVVVICAWIDQDKSQRAQQHAEYAPSCFLKALSKQGRCLAGASSAFWQNSSSNCRRSATLTSRRDSSFAIMSSIFLVYGPSSCLLISMLSLWLFPHARPCLLSPIFYLVSIETNLRPAPSAAQQPSNPMRTHTPSLAATAVMLLPLKNKRHTARPRRHMNLTQTQYSLQKVFKLPLYA